MKSFSTVAVFALLSGSAFANQSTPVRATESESEHLAARAEIDNFVNKFSSFTDGQKKVLKDTLTASFGPKKAPAAQKKPASQGKQPAAKPKPQSSSKPKRAAPAKAPAPPPSGGSPAGHILGGAGAAAGANIGLKKLLNETERHRHHNGTKHHGIKHNGTRSGRPDNSGDSILTNLFERGAPGKSSSSSGGSGVGSSVASGVASGAASAGLSNLLNEIESHFKRQVFAIGEVNGHPIDPKLNHGPNPTHVQEGSSGGVIAERGDILHEIESYLRRRRISEETTSHAASRRTLDNHDAYFSDLLAARNAAMGATIDDLD